MSIFSRLFKGPEDGEKDPGQEDAAPGDEGPEAERAKKPATEGQSATNSTDLPAQF